MAKAGLNADRAVSEIETVYRWVRGSGVDRHVGPSAEERMVLARRLSGLGDVEPLLSWIFSMLFGRWLAHPITAHMSATDTHATEAPCSAR
jgi:hypothetical protein